VHLTATRRAKQWVPEYWRTVIRWCTARGLSVGVIGSNLQIERERYHSGEWEEQLIVETGIQDLRGATTLPVLAGAFRQARAAVVVDAGPLHLAAAVGCPTVCIFGNDEDGDGASPIHLWAPRGPQVSLVRTPVKCTVCVERRFKNEDCLVAGHPCMRELRPERVITTLERALECRDA
jgi:ADP-heptose:LPS heptosyltransferase